MNIDRELETIARLIQDKTFFASPEEFRASVVECVLQKNPNDINHFISSICFLANRCIGCCNKRELCNDDCLYCVKCEDELAMDS